MFAVGRPKAMNMMIRGSDRSGALIKSKNRTRAVKVLTAISLSLALYGLIGWVYVAISALAVPNTLHLPLTHLFPHLREDTSGVIGFAVSFIGFVLYQIFRDSLFSDCVHFSVMPHLHLRVLDAPGGAVRPLAVYGRPKRFIRAFEVSRDRAWPPSPCGRLSRPPWPGATPAATTGPPSP